MADSGRELSHRLADENLEDVAQARTPPDPLFPVPLRWPAGQTADPVGAATRERSDTLIADALRRQVCQRLPTCCWQRVNAPSLLWLPMLTTQAPFALVCVAQDQPGARRGCARQPAPISRHASGL